MTAPTVPTVTTAAGVTINASMTPTERYNAVAKSLNAPTVDRPAPQQQWHTNETIAEFARRDAQVVKAPAAKPVAPAVTPPASGLTPQQEFEADIRARGLTHEAPIPTPAEQQTADIELVSTRYAALMQAGKSMPEEQRLRFKRAYESDVANILNGKSLTDAQRAQLSKTGNVESFVPVDKKPGVTPKPAETPAQTFTPEQWLKGHESVTDPATGEIPLERVNVESLSGYKMPAHKPGQTVTTAIFGMLAQARKAGISQAQVTAWVLADGGWLK